MKHTELIDHGSQHTLTLAAIADVIEEEVAPHTTLKLTRTGDGRWMASLYQHGLPRAVTGPSETWLAAIASLKGMLE